MTETGNYRYLDKAKSEEHKTYKKANVGIQAIIAPKHYIPPTYAASHKLSIIDFPHILYFSHSVTFLFLGMAILFSAAYYLSQNSPTTFTNTQM
jgi:hypothetical protein